MNNFWLSFQGRAGDVFAGMMSHVPGSALLKLSVFSAVLGLILIWLYRFVSFQNKLESLKKKILTIALEPFLFSDSARISLLSPLKLVLLAVQYMAISIPPLVILAGPVVWLLGLWNQVVGYAAPQLHDQIPVSIEADSSRDLRQLQISVVGTGFSASPLVRSYRDAEAWLGLSADEISHNAGLVVKIGTSSVQIPIMASPTIPMLTTKFWNRLFFPGSNLQMPAGLKQVSIEYPARYFECFGIHLPWAVLFLIISMVSGLIFAKLLRIQI